MGWGATPITFYYSGVVNSVVDQLSELDGSIAEGTAFSGSYTFESTEPDEKSSDPTRGQYYWGNENGNDFFFDATIGNYAFETNWVSFSDGLGNKVVRGSLTYLSLDPPTAPVPEPSTIILLGLGLIGLAGISRKRIKRRVS